jgi:NAD(P)-dependent dehydrogenase (short-subunit alcohol dehydrogenase family)
MSTRHLTILTGASRGMGLAMAQQLLAAGHDLLCIARKPNDALAPRQEPAPPVRAMAAGPGAGDTAVRRGWPPGCRRSDAPLPCLASP